MKTIIADKFPIEIPSLIGSYEFVRILEHTSYSVIVLVRAHSIDYACKVVSRAVLLEHDLLEFFEREIRILETLSHPHVVRLVDVLYSPALIFVIMEYCAGGDVLHGIQSHGRYSDSDCRRIFSGVLHGVAYLHARDISHRDIKPDNILLDRDGRAKIADFGLSRQIVRNRLLDTPCGSLEYCPPEVLRGGTYDGKAADIWSLGILLYGMCAGRLPWASRNDAEIYAQVMRGDFEMPACACGAIRRMLRRMLCGAPSERATVGELLGDGWIEEGAKVRRLAESVSLTGPNMRLAMPEGAWRGAWKTKMIVRPIVGRERSRSPNHQREVGTSRNAAKAVGRPLVAIAWLG